jgi:hypothetical protein
MCDKLVIRQAVNSLGGFSVNISEIYQSTQVQLGQDLLE